MTSCHPNNSTRVVVTGTGALCGLGSDVETIWNRLVAGDSGIRYLDDRRMMNNLCRIGSTVPNLQDDTFGFDAISYLGSKDAGKMARFMQLAVAAADQAVIQADWSPASDWERERTAVIMGTSIGGFDAVANLVRTAAPSTKVSPFSIPMFLNNLAAGHISIRHGFTGITGTPTTSCVASTQAIGDGMRLIRSGEADVVICGGSEACVEPEILAGFAASRAVDCTSNEQPRNGSRPFNIDRSGFVLGEGAAVFVIESLEHALNRGSTPIAEITGYASFSDAHHITSCLPDGLGLQRTMKAAMQMAGITATDISYINAHGTSTPLGDRSELNAIKAIFGEGPNVSVSSTKSSTGHLLGAAGALEAIFSIMSLAKGTLPPTLNLISPDPIAEKIDLIGSKQRQKNCSYVLSNSAGFGGLNASLVFKRWEGA